MAKVTPCPLLLHVRHVCHVCHGGRLQTSFLRGVGGGGVLAATHAALALHCMGQSVRARSREQSTMVATYLFNNNKIKQ